MTHTISARSFTTWKLLKVLCAIVITPIVSIHAEDKELSLAVSGKTSFVIVTAQQPTAEEKTAAEWLSTTLEQVTGAKFSLRPEDANDLPTNVIRVLVDPTLPSEAWRIRTSGDELILAGGWPRGTLYAVCEFLESHVGVDRLDPFIEVVPKRPTLTIPILDRRGRPAFGSRFVFNAFPYAHPAPMKANARMWRAWNKEQTYSSPSTGDHPRLVPEPGGHTFGRFIPVKEFAHSHPEYFSMDSQGKRMIDDQGEPSAWYQVCLTNPDVRRITLDRARTWLRDDFNAAKSQEREPARYLALSQNDNTSNLCLCPNCKLISDREGSESGLLLDYVNDVARGLKDEFPDVLVLTEAYNFTLKPPRSIRPERNVIIRYCDNYGLSDMTRPLTHPINAERLGLLEDWMKISHQMAVWDYWRMFEDHPPGFFAPSSNVRAMQADLKRFQQGKVQFVFSEIEDFMGAGLNSTPTSNDLQSFLPLRAWVAMKLLDDPLQDLDKLLKRFCDGYYGAGSTSMRGLLELIENCQSTTTGSIVPRRRHVWTDAICDATFFSKAYRHLDMAVEATAADARSLIHVRRERIVIDSAYLWTEAAVRRQDPTTAGQLPPRAEVVQRFRDDWSTYVASAFDEHGQAEIAPLISPGIELVAKLKTENTDPLRHAVPIQENEVTVDGKLNEPFWSSATPLRLMPRDPQAANDDESAIRFAWTPEALYVGIEQPIDDAAAYWEVSLMEPSRKGDQVALFVQPAGAIAAYYYHYLAEGGMLAVPERKSLSNVASIKTSTTVSGEIRIPWTDLPATPKAGDDFLMNVGTYPKPDSKSPSHVSSPWLIGTSPTYNPAYHGRLKLRE